MVLSLRSSHWCYQWTVIQPFELKNTYFYSLRASFHPFPTVIFLDSNPLSNIPTDCFLLFQTKPVYFLLIPWLLTKLTRFHYLRSNGKNHIINNYVKGNENERLFTFLFFKFINLKFFYYEQKIFKCNPVRSLDGFFNRNICIL